MEKVKTLTEMINNDFQSKNDLSCSEAIMFGANEVYELGLDNESMKMTAGLAAGGYTEKLCGALSAGCMVLAKKYVKERAHTSPEMQEIVKTFMKKYEDEMGGTSCAYLKEHYRTEEVKCKNVIKKAAEILDQLIASNS